MGKSCQIAMDGDEYLQFLVDSPDATAEVLNPMICDASAVAKNLVGGALVGYFLWHLMIYLMIYLLVLWRMKKPIVKYLSAVIFLTSLGVGFADHLVPSLSCGRDW